MESIRRTGWLLLIAGIVLLSGCAKVDKFDATPVKEAEFNKPMEQLRSEYADIDYYESIFRGFSPKRGDLITLEEKWGKPVRVEKNWGSRIASFLIGAGLYVMGGWPLPIWLGIEAMNPYPSYTFVWEKGDKMVEATVRKNAFTGFENRFGTWKWEEVEQTLLADTGSEGH